MLNLLWLLLPVAAAGGWFAARRATARQTPPAFNYYQGLNYLLNEQPDKAVEWFGDLSPGDKEAADTRLALGNMFRRRGEVERAIPIHQALVDNTDITDDLRADALFELARDFEAAGLLDRAETLFTELTGNERYANRAWQSLLLISERERDWEKAVNTASEYHHVSGKTVNHLIAHYYCELADACAQEGDVATAVAYLKQAAETDVNCARANVMWGRLALQEHDYQTAIERFEFVENQRPELMPEIIEPLFTALDSAGDQAALRAYIDRIKGRFNAYSVIKKTRAVIEKLDGRAQADDFFKDQIVKRPSLKGLRDWARGQLIKSPPAEREKVEAMCDMLDQVVADKPGFRCSDCGFRGQTLYWRCPGCGHWDTVQTVIGAEGE